jgi:hypothetical protein
MLEKPKTQIKTFGYAFNFQRALRLSGLKPDVFFGVKKTASVSLAALPYANPRDLQAAQHIWLI